MKTDVATLGVRIMARDGEIADRTLPNSLYLTKKPAFFDAGRGYRWPWVDPAGATKLHTLPGKFDSLVKGPLSNTHSLRADPSP